MVSQLTLDEFRNTPAGQTIEKVLNTIAIGEMEALSRAGRPAVLALDAALPAGFRLGDNEKQHAGRMIRDHMGKRGWRVGVRRQFRGGRVFSSGAVYEPVATATSAARPFDERPPEIADFATRMRWAQELVQRESRNAYSVDDFIRDRRAEAAREDRF